MPIVYAKNRLECFLAQRVRELQSKKRCTVCVEQFENNIQHTSVLDKRNFASVQVFFLEITVSTH